MWRTAWSAAMQGGMSAAAMNGGGSITATMESLQTQEPEVFQSSLLWSFDNTCTQRSIFSPYDTTQMSHDVSPSDLSVRRRICSSGFPLPVRDPQAHVPNLELFLSEEVTTYVPQRSSTYASHPTPQQPPFHLQQHPRTRTRIPTERARPCPSKRTPPQRRRSPSSATARRPSICTSKPSPPPKRTPRSST